jgi:YfiH family protein
MPYGAFNLGDHVGDNPVTVAQHRTQLAAFMQGQALWLNQVHGNRVVRLSWHGPQLAADGLAVPLTMHAHRVPQADGSFTTEPGLICTVMVADCLPILLAAPEGRGVAALHAGWRGLLGEGQGMQGRGIVATGVEALCQAAACEPADLQAWLGPCIGPDAFEVGADVLQASQLSTRFTPRPGVPSKWLADLPGLARDELARQGVVKTTGGRWCTVSNPAAFFSFRRDGITGRQAACISLARR